MARIDKGFFGTCAFTSDNHLVMSNNKPCVAWSFRIKELEDWLTTMEEIMQDENMLCHRSSLEGLYCSLKAAHAKHLEQHNDVVTSAPTADDLMEYLAAYAASIVPSSTSQEH